MSRPAPTPRPRLLLVSQSLAMGGVETMICDLARLVRTTEFDIEVATLEGGGTLEAELTRAGVRIHDLGKRPGLDMRVALRLRRLIRDRGVTVVHTHNFAPWMYTVFASLGVRNLRRVHTQHSEVPGSPVRHVVARFCATHTTEVVAVSAAVQTSLVQAAGLPRATVRVITNGINTDRFRPDPERRAVTRQALGLLPHDIAVGVIARLVPLKAHRDLLDAMAIAVKTAPAPLRLLIVGDGPELTSLRAQASTLGLESVVTFLGERRDTDALLTAMDVYALASTTEGMNLTLLEATAAGLPAVATAVGGNPEIVEDGTTGHLVPVADPSGLAKAILALAANESDRQRMGAAGRARALRCFDERSMFAGYLSAYRGADSPAGHSLP